MNLVYYVAASHVDSVVAMANDHGKTRKNNSVAILKSSHNLIELFTTLVWLLSFHDDLGFDWDLEPPMLSGFRIAFVTFVQS